MKCLNGEALLVETGADTWQNALVVCDSSSSAPAVYRFCFDV